MAVDLDVTIEPLGDRIVVIPVEKEQVTASGIIIPETADKEKPQQGEVIALGKGGIRDEHGEVPDPSQFLKVGDTVLFGKYAGDEIKLKDKEGKEVEVKVLRLNSVLGKVL